MYSTIHQEIPGQIAKNKSQTYFCNEQEKQAWARETGGHTRGGLSVTVSCARSVHGVGHRGRCCPGT